MCRLVKQLIFCTANAILMIYILYMSTYPLSLPFHGLHLLVVLIYYPVDASIGNWSKSNWNENFCASSVLWVRRLVYYWLKYRKKQRRAGDEKLLLSEHACWWLWQRAGSFKSWWYMLFDTVSTVFFSCSCPPVMCKNAKIKKATPDMYLLLDYISYISLSFNVRHFVKCESVS